MNLKQLEYFTVVADKGSFSRAAVALNLAQPSVSRQVALLEKDVGQRLLERTGHGVTPTEAGRMLLIHARNILSEADRASFAMKEIGTEPQGKVVLGVPNHVAARLCAPLIRSFRAQYPNALLSIVEGLSPSIREGLIAGGIDVGLLFDPAPTPLLAYQQLRRERLILVAPQRFRLPPTVSLQSLGGYPMVLPAAQNPIRALLDACLAPQHVTLQLIAEVGAVQSAIGIAEDGLACSVLPSSALHLARSRASIRTSPIGPPAIWNRLVLATPTARPHSRIGLAAARLLRSIDLR